MGPGNSNMEGAKAEAQGRRERSDLIRGAGEKQNRIQSVANGQRRGNEGPWRQSVISTSLGGLSEKGKV